MSTLDIQDMLKGQSPVDFINGLLYNQAICEHKASKNGAPQSANGFNGAQGPFYHNAAQFSQVNANTAVNP